MSVRLLTVRLAKHGRYFLKSFWRREIHANILEQNKQANGRLPTTAANISRSFAAPTIQAARKAINTTVQTGVLSSESRTGIFRFGQHARKLFIDNILNRITSPYSEELRNQAAKKLFYGDSAHFFALVGVGLASGAGVLTKEDELEGVCWEIREAAHRLQSNWSYDEVSETLTSDFNIDRLDIGPAIAKGCAAVVYAAAFKNKEHLDVSTDADSTKLPERGPLNPDAFLPQMLSPLQNISRFVHNFGGSVDNLSNLNYQHSAAVVFTDQLTVTQRQMEQLEEEQKLTERNVSSSAEEPKADKITSPTKSMQADLNRYPLALKMMFNYDVQSNALAIQRAMYKETIPARRRCIDEAACEMGRFVQQQTLTLPPHPNIVCMFGFFSDEVRNFPDGHLLYPSAQPQRINPQGYGRNMSLYLLMKRYDYTLRQLLEEHNIGARSKLLLLAQLLEAVAHINRHGIAHRDLKSDNLLIELNDDGTTPLLVLSDFGCCIADSVHGLQVPYTSYDIDKGGNAALMAPEIINKQAGPFAVLNYAKADLWACGAIAYEIFGQRNPFYANGAKGLGEAIQSLRNSEYQTQDLPALNNECPLLVKHLIYNILNPNPKKRVSPDIAANVLQLLLWAPSNWLKAGGMPNSPEILQWLLSLSTKIICEGRAVIRSNSGAIPEVASFNPAGRRTYVEYLLICSFLARARLRRIRGALNWIQNIV